MKANVEAYAMHRIFDEPLMSTIWGTIELPTPKLTTNQGGQVDQVCQPLVLTRFV